MIRYVLTAMTAAGLLTAARPVKAQTPPAGPAPVQPAGPMHPSLGVMGFAPALRPGGTSLTNREEPGLLRRAMPAGDIRDWIAGDDPSVEQLRDPSTPTTRAGLRFEIGADGRATGCRLVDGFTNAVTEGLCERMAQRMAMVPALDPAGDRVPDAYVVYVSFDRRNSAPARTVDHMMLPPAPPPPPSPGGWPPYSERTTAVVEGLDLLPGGGSAPEAAGEPWTGVDISADENGRLTCRVVASSGNGRLDRDACNAARRARYTFPGATRSYQRHTAIHFVRHGGRPRAMLPEHEHPARAVITAASHTAVRAAAPKEGLDAVRLRLEIDAAGRATQCLVTATSGVDATDIAACRLTLEHARFEPAEDVFGRARESSLYDWAPAPAETADGTGGDTGG